jgi:thiol-disulfide isomerase/thioredoxin
VSRYRWFLPTLLAAAAPVVLDLGADAGEPASIKLQVVKHKQLLQELKKLRGKVVVVDIWGEFCLPCKQEFPHLVALHRKYGKDGVVCVSVSVDEPDDAKAHERALAFLKARGAAFPNYLIDDKAQVWQDHFDINGPPAVFVYGRDGALAGRFDHNDVNKNYSYRDVEKLVRKVLSKTGRVSP